MNWVKISGSFFADGGDEYLSLGHFLPNNSINCIPLYPNAFPATELFIDDIYVYQCEKDVYTDRTICRGDSVNLIDRYFLDHRYIWTSADGYYDTIPNPRLSPAHTTQYFLEESNFRNNVYHDTITVFVEECMDPLVIPNVFTPNGDGKNDVFEIQCDERTELNTRIFNRWGKMVFSSQNKIFWDGRINGNPASEGVYFYLVKTRDYTGKEEQFSGELSLLR